MLLVENVNSAASRVYYCLYQALIGEFERLGIRPETIDAGSARAAEGDIRLKWTHSFVRNNASLAMLSGRQCQVIRDAYHWRITADYRDSDVEADSVEDILLKAKDIRECLGVDSGIDYDRS